MADTLSQFFTWAVKDVIFFSGDVQTTTIAVAITSSLCCSIAVAVVHVIALILPTKRKEKPERKSYRSSSSPPVSSKRLSSPWITSGQIHVPCVKCGHYFADIGCRFVTCKKCCFIVLSCQIHQKTSVCSVPCRKRQTEMDLSSVGMLHCPERLGFVGTQLTCLNLADNQLTNLPTEIGCLRGLRKLLVKNNKIQSLPTTLVALSQLEVLDVSCNQLTEIPKCVTGLFNLQELYMSNNQLCAIPTDIAQLRQLLTLDISYNKFREICDVLFHLIQLECLNLKSNPICNIPPLIGNLVQLNSLDMGSCDLTSIPVSIGNCSKLKSLKLDNNRLQRLPPQIGTLGKLQSLSLENNCLKYLPAILSFLPDGLRITAHGNPLLRPEEYCEFTESPQMEDGAFPSLLELTGREIIRQNIPDIKILPQVLQGFLKGSQICTTCGGPVFQFYQSTIQPGHFLYSDTEWIPLYYQYCSPHKAEGCG